MINEGILEKFQACLEKYLSGMNEFRSIPIMVHQPSNIGAVLSNVLSGSLGIAIMILPLVPEGVVSDVPGPVFSKICCEIQVIEDLATNRTGCTAIYIAEKIMHYLHLWRPQLTDWSEKLVLSSNNPWKSTQKGNNNIISIFFETHCSFKE